MAHLVSKSAAGRSLLIIRAVGRDVLLNRALLPHLGGEVNSDIARPLRLVAALSGRLWQLALCARPAEHAECEENGEIKRGTECSRSLSNEV